MKTSTLHTDGSSVADTQGFQILECLPMTKEEAHECILKVRHNQSSTRILLLGLSDRKGWKVLGYTSLFHCLKAEFATNKSQLYREIQAARIERDLFGADEIGSHIESLLRPLAKLKTADEQREAWKEVQEMAATKVYRGKAAQFHKPPKITATIVQEVVNRRLGKVSRKTGEPSSLKPTQSGSLSPANMARLRALAKCWNCEHSDSVTPDDLLSILLDAAECDFPQFGENHTLSALFSLVLEEKSARFLPVQYDTDEQDDFADDAFIERRLAKFRSGTRN